MSGTDPVQNPVAPQSTAKAPSFEITHTAVQPMGAENPTAITVTGIAIQAPAAAHENPSATPELLAAVLARYSRSNDGLKKIFEKVDKTNPDKSVEAIFRFLDYGHASIGGLTGGIAMAVDDVSMYLAYKLFYFSQMCDGQESSTRYIKMGPESLPTPESVGIPSTFAKEWKSIMTEGFEHYLSEYARLDKLANEHPELIRYPENADDKVKDRIRKNYALDRARYFIPLATKTNIALIMSARMWAQTVKEIDALGTSEASHLAALLRKELEKFAPHLIKHSAKDEAVIAQNRQMVENWTQAIYQNGVPTRNLLGEVAVSVNQDFADFCPSTQTYPQAIEGKANRYSLVGERLNRTFVRVAWNNIAIAELRDLNRHRTGYRYTPMIPSGFYLPPEIPTAPHADYLARWSNFVERMVKSGPEGAAVLPYALNLGTQVAFEHDQMLDKFAYEAELRTGIGAHFRYAELLTTAVNKLCEIIPEAKDFIPLGTANPE